MLRKWIFMTLVLVIAAMAGLWLSGAIVTTWLGVHSPKPFVYLDYLKHLSEARYKPFAGKIKISGGVGFGLPLLAWAFMLVMAVRPRPKAIHGDARFATAGDVAAKKLFDDAPNGVVVGKLGSKLMKLAGQQFVILAAPTRSGKGVGVVIPNLLEYGESCVVLDIKQENYELTSGWRQSQGQEIYLFNPFAEDRRTHRWNPLSYVSQDPAFRVSDLQSIAAMLYPDVSDEQKFWVSQARNAFMAFALYLFDNLEDQIEMGVQEDLQIFPTLGHIYRMSSGDGSPLKEYLKAAAERTFVKPQTKTAFNNLLSQADETFASILGTFKEPLNPWINPVLDAATSANDFWLTDVRRRKMTIYIAIQPNKLAEAKLIVNLFFSQLINVNTKELPQNNKNLKQQCLLLMDEFTSIGKVDIIANAVSYMAGYNIRLLPIIQSMAQLDATYGKEVSRTIITNHALQIVYAPREQQDANDYSEMLGYTTVRKKNRSTSHGREGSVSYSEVEEKRALMLPQELKAMGNDKEIVFYEGLPHPVLAQKIRYYEDKHFTSRLLEKVEIPMVDIPGMETAKKLSAGGIAAVALAGLAACAQPAHSRFAQKDDPYAANVQDGYHPTAERLTACDHPPPPQKWEGMTDKPVPTCFGANTFMIPMNWFEHQAGPDFQGGVSLAFRFPELQALPPGMARNQTLEERDQMVTISVDYIDNVPIKGLLDKDIHSTFGPESNDPSEEITLRIKGEPFHDLTPHWTDVDALRRYFIDRGFPSDDSNVLRWADDWYLRFDSADHVATFITCTNRKYPGAKLIDGRLHYSLVDTPEGRQTAECKHEFLIEPYKLWVRAEYLRAYLPYWKEIEGHVRDIFSAKNLKIDSAK